MNFSNLLILACFFANVLSESWNIQDKLSKEWAVRHVVVEKSTGEPLTNSYLHHWTLEKATTSTEDPLYSSLTSGKWRINDTSINMTIDTKHLNIKLNNNENSGVLEYSDDTYDYKKLFEFKFFQLAGKEQVYVSNGEWLGFEGKSLAFDEMSSGFEKLSSPGHYQFILTNSYFIVNIYPKSHDNIILVWTGSIYTEKEEQGWFKKNMTSWVFFALIAFNLLSKVFMRNPAKAAAAAAPASAAGAASKKNK